jgi:hypothetical protein
MISINLGNIGSKEQAEKIANKNTQGQSLVPLPGRTSEAFGERLMQGYTKLSDGTLGVYPYKVPH